MKPVHWFIDTCIVKNHEFEFACLRDAMDGLSNKGVQVTYTQYVPFTTRVEDEVVLKGLNPDHINLVYGTHGFIRNMRDTFPNQIRAYCPEDRLKCSNYYTKIPREMLLNADGFFMPWKLIKDSPERMRRMIYGDTGRNGLGQPAYDLFVRPDSGVKTFAGTVLPENDWDHEVNAVEKLSSVSDSTLCYVARTHDIQAEYRFVIVNRQVISGSQYRRNGKLNICKDIADPQAFYLAQEFALKHWQPDVAYTCDVAIVPSYGVTRDVKAKIVELNSFSCAGLYHCDYAEVFNAVTQAAIDEEDGKVWIED